MREISKKHAILPSIIAAVTVLFVMSGTGADPFAYAQSSDQQITVKVADHLKNNPLALKIIKEMERQKLQYQQGQSIQSPSVTLSAEQAEIDQKRMTAKQRLSQRIQQLEEKYSEYTPKAAFTRFVEKTPVETHPVFWGQFDYMQGKVDDARAAMKQVIENGGSLKDARDAYFAHAATKRVELIQVTQALNIKHGLADPDVQATFDQYGKLPRYDD